VAGVLPGSSAVAVSRTNKGNVSEPHRAASCSLPNFLDSIAAAQDIPEMHTRPPLPAGDDAHLEQQLVLGVVDLSSAWRRQRGAPYRTGAGFRDGGEEAAVAAPMERSSTAERGATGSVICGAFPFQLSSGWRLKKKLTCGTRTSASGGRIKRRFFSLNTVIRI
jgi:hypothetical protein